MTQIESILDALPVVAVLAAAAAGWVIYSKRRRWRDYNHERGEEPRP